jgi:hypothetical protein
MPKFEKRYVEMLRRNEDENGEPIFSMPTINPLSLSNEVSYSTYFTDSFSIGKKFQSNFEKLIDKPKWNEITFMAQLHEILASKTDVLRASDLRQRILTKRDESHSLNESITKFMANREENYDPLLSHMNASLFFTLLFIDRELNAKLNIEKKLIIANALTFAVWKESMEIDVLLHVILGPIFRDSLHYYSSRNDHTQIFSEFCNTKMYEIKPQILGISPWAGIDEVMRILNENLKNKKNVYGVKGKADRLFGDALVKAKDYFSHDTIFSINKRHCEDQWFLIEVKGLLSSKHKALLGEIDQIIHMNVALDWRGSTQRGIDLIEKFKDDPKFQSEMKKVSEEIQEYASTILAGVVSKTGEKLIQKAVNYFIFLPYVMRLFKEWRNKGLFASLQYSITYTLQNLTNSILPNLKPHFA